MRTCMLMLALITISVGLLSGCENTARGFGQDTDRNVDAMRKEINS